jgi:hypothetical protein
VARLGPEAVAKLGSADGATGDGATCGPQPADSVSHQVEGPAAVPVDLVRVAGPSLAKRALPVLVLLAVVGGWLFVRRRRQAGVAGRPA